jgi:hypothetical protein
LVAANGTIIGDSKGEQYIGRNYADSSTSPLEMSLVRGGVEEIVGQVYITFDHEADPYVAPFVRLSASINRSLLLGGSLGIGIALILTFVLSRE